MWTSLESGHGARRGVLHWRRRRGLGRGWDGGALRGLRSPERDLLAKRAGVHRFGQHRRFERLLPLGRLAVTRRDLRHGGEDLRGEIGKLVRLVEDPELIESFELLLGLGAALHEWTEEVIHVEAHFTELAREPDNVGARPAVARVLGEHAKEAPLRAGHVAGLVEANGRFVRQEGPLEDLRRGSRLAACSRRERGLNLGLRGGHAVSAGARASLRRLSGSLAARTASSRVMRPSPRYRRRQPSSVCTPLLDCCCSAVWR
jgi:hypothetical protein